MPAPRPTLRDLAHDLGVSAMTVSRALRGRPGVAAELGNRIRARAEALGYRPDPNLRRLALHLRRRRQRDVRAVIAAITDIPVALEPAYCALLIRHAAAHARTHGFAFSTLRIAPNQGGEEALARVLRARGVEGVLLLPMLAPTAFAPLLWTDFSVVAATSSITSPVFHRVVPDHAANARLLVARLAAAGHRRLGFVGTTTHTARTGEAFPSALAWHHARHGLRCRPYLHPPDQQPSAVAWAEREQPDVVIVGRPEDLPRHRAEFASAGLTPAWALAGALPVGKDTPALDERHDLIGTAAVDALAGLIVRGERGVPPTPTSICLPGDWREVG